MIESAPFEIDKGGKFLKKLWCCEFISLAFSKN